MNSDILDQSSHETGCPKCGSAKVSPVTYTWWGGIIGPRMMNHTKCESCNYRFNSKTRLSNTNNIIIYSVVVLVIAIGVVILI